MKKALSILLVGLLFSTLFTGCSSSVSETATDTISASASGTEVNEANTEKPLIYVFVKNRGDLASWDSIAEGGDSAAKDFADRADIRVVETTADLTAGLTALYEAADAGADMIITSNDIQDCLVEVANAFPNLACVSIAENVVDRANNIYGIDFLTSDASFLAGIVASDIAKQSGSDTVGFIGGIDEYVIIQEFLVGYIQGVKYANSDINVVYNYVGGWNDPDTARVQALAQYNDAEAACIFACAGGSGNGVHTAAAQTGKYVIGVDTDQSLLYSADPEIQSRFVTSVLKLCNNAVYNTIEQYLDEGTLPFGEYRILGVSDNAVGIVENDLYNKYVSDEGKAMVEQARQDMADGKINVTSVLGMEQAEIKTLIDDFLK